MSNHPERVADYLQHILDAIERAITYAAQAGNADAFKGHPLLQDDIVRNKLIHDYFDVDPDIVWSTVQQDLPVHANQIRALLSATMPTHGS